VDQEEPSVLLIGYARVGGWNDGERPSIAPNARGKKLSGRMQMHTGCREDDTQLFSFII
jgi:hypothetical protein